MDRIPLLLNATLICLEWKHYLLLDNKCIEYKLNLLLTKFSGVFADPEESLPFNTKVIARIRTVDNDPVYSKLYPYPPPLAEFVNKEIEDWIKNGIIVPSRSPYNNPIWVVDKKGFDENGKRKKRLVIDYRKLNEKNN